MGPSALRIAGLDLRIRELGYAVLDKGDLEVPIPETQQPGDERKKYIREFEKRLIDEEAHYLYTLQWHRIIPHNAKVKGWTVTPSHYLNNQLDTVWLTE